MPSKVADGVSGSCPPRPRKFFEYLALGLVVIAPDSDFYRRLDRTYNIGELIKEPTVDGIATAIKSTLLMTREEFEISGAKNRAVFRDEFTWGHVAARVEAVLAGRRPDPEKWMTF
jgi:glycosyltransferase involved in cell wall biosynthesis